MLNIYRVRSIQTDSATPTMDPKVYWSLQRLLENCKILCYSRWFQIEIGNWVQGYESLFWNNCSESSDKPAASYHYLTQNNRSLKPLRSAEVTDFVASYRPHGAYTDIMLLQHRLGANSFLPEHRPSHLRDWESKLFCWTQHYRPAPTVSPSCLKFSGLRHCWYKLFYDISAVVTFNAKHNANDLIRRNNFASS